jgi:hypothetical protein
VQLTIAVASGALGFAVLFVVWRFRRAPDAVDLEPAPNPSPAVATIQANAHWLGAFLLFGALASTAYVGTLLRSRGFPLAIGDRLIQVGGALVSTAALVLGVVIVVTARRAANPHRAVRGKVDVVVAALAVAIIAVEGYAVAYVVAWHGDRNLSILAQATMSEKRGYVAIALVCIFLAFGALHLLSQPMTAFDSDADDAVTELQPL